jgi:chitodextrinase
MTLFKSDSVIGKVRTIILITMLASAVIPILNISPVKALFGTSFDKYAGNPLTTIPTYGATGVVHPDVIYFSGGMDGYKYWMTYTPYPPQSMENPSVTRSNDGITWTDIGITNPVIPEGTPGAWNDLENPDPDFIYASDYGKWFLIWNGGDTATNSRKIALAYSSDGKTWTQYDGALVNGNPNPIILAGDDNAGQSWERSGSISKTSCPTLLYENGVFTLYYVEEASGNNNGQVGFATFTWNDSTHSVENLARYSGNPTITVGCGHIDLSKKDNVYYLYAVKSSLILLTSTDKIHWTNQGTVLEGGQGWDGSIYRSSATTDPSGQIALFNGKMKLYYSAFGNPQIGLATSEGPLSRAWYDSSWARRKQITVVNSNPASLAGYQVKVDVNYDSDMKSDFSDLRFIDEDGVTSIPYWIESYVPSTSATIWVRVPYVASTGSDTIYMYYGNPTATSLSDGRATFELLDDFESGYGTGWTVKATMPSPPKADGSAAVYNGRLYVFGGYDQTAGDPRAETYEYDPLSNTWTQKASMPTARWGPIAVEFNGKIYVFSGTAADVNEVYDPVSDTWQTKSSVPPGFNQGLMGVRYGDKIHLFYHTLHYEYDPATDTYVAKTSMPTPRRWSTVAVVGNKIYVIGGYHNSYGAVNQNEVYDPATDTWTTKTPMPISKYGITRENPVINGKIYVTHGLNGGFHTDNYVYDPSTDSWEQKSSANYPRDGTECGVINNKLYVVGGRADSAGPYGVYYNEEYDPSSDSEVLWTFSNPEKVRRDTSAKLEGNYGLMIYDDTTQSEYAEHTHTLPALAVDFDWDMTNDLGEATQQPQGRILLVDPLLSNYGTLWYYRDTDGTAKFKWYTGSFLTLQTGNWNTWCHITLIWNGADSKVIIDGVEHAVTATSAASDRIRLESSAVESSKMYFDSVRVRKYVSSEPSVTIGLEEALPPPPIADFTWSPSEPKVGDIVTFNASSSTGGTIAAYEWDFGDGRTANGEIVNYIYSEDGTYLVSLKVTDSLGLSDTEQKQIQIEPLPATPAPWFNASWTKRKQIAIINSLNPDTLTDFQVKLAIKYESYMKADFSDLRFTDSNGQSLIPYWIEKYVTSASATVWVKVPSIPTSGTARVYMYYGNPAAISIGNGTATFEFFDDFAGTVLDTEKWTQNAVNSITHTMNNYFRFEDATKAGGSYWIYGDSRGRIGSQHQANWNPLTQFVVEFKSTLSDTDITQMGEGFVGVVSSTNTVIGVAGYQDWLGAGYNSQRAVITENEASSLGTGVAKRSDSLYDAYKAVGQSDATNWKIIDDGSTLKFYDGDGFYAEAGLSSTVSKVALAAGAYGGYPYLDYVEIDYIMIHKYAAVEPTSNVGAEQTFTGNPTLTMNPNSITCHKYNETFTVQINVSNPNNTKDFRFEIHYNATLLDVAYVSWTGWGSGTYTSDEVVGNLTGYTQGDMISGDTILVTITFNATYHHIWKIENTVPDWKNNLTGSIYLQWANLSYEGSPDLSYVIGGSQNQIDVGAESTYNFCPIQGDINNDGTVNIYDIRSVAAFYNIKIGDPYWNTASVYDLNGDNIIDIFDLVIVVAKFGTI